MTAPLLIHVGFHKTATSWMQRRLFTLGHGFHPVAGHREAHDLVVAPHGFEFDAGRLRDALGAGAAKAAEGAAPVFSSEILSGNPFFGGHGSDVFAERLAAGAPGARILVSIRDQMRILPSIYQQYVRRGGALPYDRFFEPDTIVGYPAFSPAHFEYDRLVTRYQALFGAERVLVVTQEAIGADAAAAAAAIARFAGAEAFQGLDRAAAERDAPSEPEFALPVLRRLNHARREALHPWPALDGGGALYRAAAWLARKAPGTEGLRRRRPVSDHVRRRFAGRYDESNARLAAIAAHPLDISGYGGAGR